jgi:GT2 family glycosyltransferase
MRPSISVVVPTYNRRLLLERTLPEVVRQAETVPGAEVVVVVDGSRDGTVEMLRSANQSGVLRIVTQENRGLAAARNKGVERALSPTILFLDDDMIPGAGLIEAHRKAHADGEERVIYGALGLAPGVRRSFLKVGVELWGEEMKRRLAEPGHRFRYDDCHFGHASISRRWLERTVGFDESFVRFGNEDYDLGSRLIEMGAEMRFLPHAVAYQIYDKSLRRWLNDCRCVGMADLALARKHPFLAPELRFAASPRHPLRRLARRCGTTSLDPLAPAWSLVEVGLSILERVGARGEFLGKAQSLLGERCYWQGIRMAGGRPTACVSHEAARQRRSA